MGRLSLSELRSRLALDYRAMRALRGSSVGAVRAYETGLDRLSNCEISQARGEAGYATVYRATFRFPMLASTTQRLHEATAVFELPTRNYPFEAPRVSFEVGAIPFSPHISPTSGAVCLGSAWTDARGHWLLPHLVVHVMKLANFDEPCTRDGFSQGALHYALQVLKGRPLNPNLDYPLIDACVSHSGTLHEAAPVIFRRAAISGAPEASTFRRRFA